MALLQRENLMTEGTILIAGAVAATFICGMCQLGTSLGEHRNRVYVQRHHCPLTRTTPPVVEVHFGFESRTAGQESYTCANGAVIDLPKE